MILSLAIFAAVTLFPIHSSGAIVRLGVSGGFSDPVTEGTFDSANPGPTFGGEALLGLSPSFYVGAAFDYSSYELDYYENNIEQFDVQAVTRYFFPGQVLHFFVGGVLGYSRQSIDLPASSVTQDLGSGASGSTLVANGFSAGPVIGVAIDAGPVAFDVSIGGYYRHFGDAQNESADQTEPTATDGVGFVGRVGIAIPFGDTGD